MPFPDPVVVSGFFLRPGGPGPARIRTELMRSGRTTAFGAGSLAGRQGGRPGHGRVRPGFGQDGLVFLDGAPPDLPPPEECVGAPVGSFGLATIAERIDSAPPSCPGGTPACPGRPASEFWMRFADGRDADCTRCRCWSTPPRRPCSSSASPPPPSSSPCTCGPVPRPAGWPAGRANRFVSGGYHEEDFEIWDSAGTLVAQSRQLALILPL